MKNKKRNYDLKKVGCLSMSLLLSMGVTACGPSDGPTVDPNRTQIYLAVTSEGLNESWLTSVIEGFEKEYPDYQVLIDPYALDETADFETFAAGSRADIFYLQKVEMASTMLQKGLIEDITDVVTQGDSKFDNGASIESLIHENFKSQYQYTKTDGSVGYYGLPYVMMPFGITYDADLFAAPSADNPSGKSLYDLTQYKGLDCVEGNEDDNYGPDGKANTYDDGLPATWEDFKALMNVMRQKGVTPFAWSGQHAFQRYYMIYAMTLSYEGADDYRQYFELSGTDSYSEETITMENGYLLADRPSHKAALTAAYDIVSNPKNYSSNSFMTTQTHLSAQNEFLVSSTQNAPIAMLFDGVWWEHEAKATFNEMASDIDEKYGYGKRNFKFMPLPKFIGTEGVTDQTFTGTTLWNLSGESLVALNASSNVKEGAKLFLRWSHTQAALEAFTMDNGLIRPYEYSFEGEELNQISPLAQSVWSLWKDPSVEIASNVVLDETISRNSSLIRYFFLNEDPYREFYADSTLTVAKYLEALREKTTETAWKRDFKID